MHRYLALPSLLVVHARVEWVSSPASDRMLLPAAPSNAYDIAPSPTTGIRDINVYKTCTWGSAKNRYDHKITRANTPLPQDDANPYKCMPNVFATGRELAYPYPRSSYHYDLDGTLLDPKLEPNPHIELDVVPDTSVNGKASAALPTAYYTYDEFEARGDQALYGATTHDAPGVFKYALTAYDYASNPSLQCEACLSVTDLFRPFGDKGCCDNPVTASFTQKNIDTRVAQVNALVAFRTNSKNNKCSDDRCDEVTLSATKFLVGGTAVTNSFDKTAVSDKLTSWPTCLSKAVGDDEWLEFSTNAFDATTGDLVTHKGTCQRSCHYCITLKEYYTPYSCGVPYDGLTSRRVCDGDGSQSCAFTQTLTATSSDLVHDVKVSLKPATTISPVPIPKPNELFPGSNYKGPYDNGSRELHFDLDCDNNNAAFNDYCADTNRFRVGNLFSFTSALQDDVAVLNLFAGRITPADSSQIDVKKPYDASAIVFWRVKSASGPWLRLTTDGHLENNGFLTFKQLKTTLTFEAWTACGRIVVVPWDIYVHRRELVHIDDWWFSLWSCGAGKCNVQHTDFRACTFTFDQKCSTYLAMLNPDTAVKVPTDKDGNAYKTCEYRGADNTKQKCTNGCWWHYTSCDVGDGLTDADSLLARQSDCNDRIYQEGTQFAWCNATGQDPTQYQESTTNLIMGQVLAEDVNLAPPAVQPSAAGSTYQAPPAPPAPVVAPAVAPAPEVSIKWDYYGLRCTWQYKLSAPTTDYWLDTTKLGIKQQNINMDIALKMQNVDVTQVTVACDFFFSPKNKPVVDVIKDAVKRSRNKTILIQNCDHPRFNVDHPDDHGVFIKDTCKKTFPSNPLKPADREPAPFQACAGALVFPSSYDVTSANSVTQTKTLFLDTTKSADLKCCNSDTLNAKFTCRPFSPEFKTLKLCSDSPSPKPYYVLPVGGGYGSGGSSYGAYSLALVQAYTAHITAAAVALVGVVAAVIVAVGHRRRHADDLSDMADGYAPLLN
ncbi:Aste57867_12277 [Aphanomyces stellatus]|uniref:Aste57867_12277 protein n=1 Tax=Aphanomyces stellatus TaxID=120398 RepID=A0A485KV50_9STRA|nr:hypothetical protein As57867_012232 [Aphanomyces stellatus]VFT89130.1 Aste57867_12277 [Aphanomyces stellatus]